jgi:predicted sulfurtransferase
MKTYFDQSHIEETINLANNGISAMLSSYSRTPEQYQTFLQPDADGDLICQRILDTLLRLPYDRVILERINC